MLLAGSIETKSKRRKLRTFSQKLHIVACSLFGLAILNLALLHLLQDSFFANGGHHFIVPANEPIIERLVGPTADEEHSLPVVKEPLKEDHHLLSVIEDPIAKEPIEKSVIEDPVAKEPIEKSVIEDPVAKEPIEEIDTFEYSSDVNILPKKIITVIGKESSGTTFVANTIAEALELPGAKKKQKYRDGNFHHEARRLDENPVQVQHVSLPQGEWCVPGHEHHIVDVILPAQCVFENITDGILVFPGDRIASIQEQCQNLLRGNASVPPLPLFEGRAELHGTFDLRREVKEDQHFRSVRYPGRTFNQSAIVRNNKGSFFQNKKSGLRGSVQHHAAEAMKHLHAAGRFTVGDAGAEKKGVGNTMHRKLREQRDGIGAYKVRRAAFPRPAIPKKSKVQEYKEWVESLDKMTVEELKEKNLIRYPPRFLLNITAQRLWYEARGTEQVIVIVVRDEVLGLKSRMKLHCEMSSLAVEEEGIATALLNEVVQTFFLDDNKSDGLQSGFHGRWRATSIENVIQNKSIWDPTPIINNNTDPKDPLRSSLVPANNNVVLISYEAMMKYKQDFVQELYKALGIESDYQPEMNDANAKYSSNTKKKVDNNVGKLGRRRQDLRSKLVAPKQQTAPKGGRAGVVPLAANNALADHH